MIQHPVTGVEQRCKLWDHTGVGKMILLQLGPISLLFRNRAIGSGCRFLEKYNQDKGCFISSIQNVSDGITLCIDQFEEKTSKSNGLLMAGDTNIPFTLKKKAVYIFEKDVQFFDSSLRAMWLSASSRNPVYLANFFKIWITCCLQGPSCTVHVEAMIFNATFKLIPIPPVPLIPTALANNLNRENGGSPKSGVLSMDASGHLIVLLDSDPRLSSSPLVGIWVTGVESVTNSYIWGTCLHYTLCSEYVQRLCMHPQPFLLLFYQESGPQFFDCFANQGSNASFSLLKSQTNITVTKVPSFSNTMTKVVLEPVEDRNQLDLFFLSASMVSREMRNPCLPRKSSSSINDLPRSKPEPTTINNFPLEPSVPDLSLLSSHEENPHRDFRCSDSHNSTVFESPPAMVPTVASPRSRLGCNFGYLPKTLHSPGSYQDVPTHIHSEPQPYKLPNLGPAESSATRSYQKTDQLRQKQMNYQWTSAMQQARESLPKRPPDYGIVSASSQHQTYNATIETHRKAQVVSLKRTIQEDNIASARLAEDQFKSSLPAQTPLSHELKNPLPCASSAYQDNQMLRRKVAFSPQHHHRNPVINQQGVSPFQQANPGTVFRAGQVPMAQEDCTDFLYTGNQHHNKELANTESLKIQKELTKKLEHQELELHELKDQIRELVLQQKLNETPMVESVQKESVQSTPATYDPHLVSLLHQQDEQLRALQTQIQTLLSRQNDEKVFHSARKQCSIGIMTSLIAMNSVIQQGPVSHERNSKAHALGNFKPTVLNNQKDFKKVKDNGDKCCHCKSDSFLDKESMNIQLETFHECNTTAISSLCIDLKDYSDVPDRYTNSEKIAVEKITAVGESASLQKMDGQHDFLSTHSSGIEANDVLLPTKTFYNQILGDVRNLAKDKPARLEPYWVGSVPQEAIQHHQRKQWHHSAISNSVVIPHLKYKTLHLSNSSRNREKSSCELDVLAKKYLGSDNPTCLETVAIGDSQTNETPVQFSLATDAYFQKHFMTAASPLKTLDTSLFFSSCQKANALYQTMGENGCKETEVGTFLNIEELKRQPKLL